MKIVAVYLSSRKGSVSTQVIDAMMDGAEEAGAEVRRFNVGNTILGCRGCGSCQSGKSDKCVIKDGLEDYWTEVRDADVVVIGAANYMGNVMGQAVSFFNRHYCANDSSKGMANRVCRIPAGKKLIGVFSQGAPMKEAYLQPYQNYLGSFKAYGMEAETPIVVTAADVSEEGLAAFKAQGKALVG